MKKTILLFVGLLLSSVASMAHSRVSETATVVGDTLYYAANQMRVKEASQASYYRLLMKQSNGRNSEDVFKDFYMNGTVKAEGGYAFVDLNNDKNTVLNGDFTTYYPNGKEKMRGRYVNGQRQGFFVLQLRSGGVAVVEYRDGKSAHDYFMVTTPDGNQEKRPLEEIKTLLQ